VLAAVIYGFLPERIPVEVASVERGPLQVIVEEEGETQVEQRFVISSPVYAFARRIDLKEGDLVSRDQALVRLEPPRSSMLDPSTRVEVLSRVTAAEARLAQALQQTRAAEAIAERGTEEYRRTERLFEAGSAMKQTLEQARAEASRATADAEASRSAVDAARADVTAARAALEYGDGESLQVRETLRSPIAGRVLIIHRESEGMVNPGEPLLEVGDTGALEVRVDVLSQDAVRIEPGTRVLLDQWGGGDTLRATVKRVQPQGVTEISSLGVEEKRVTVVAELDSSAAGLAAGYRVLARFIVWEGDNLLLVPTSALFRSAGGWSVFSMEDGVAVRKSVQIGHQTGLMAEVLSGLEEGDEVIVHPANTIEEGTRVESLHE
jgi:HlyD family secretion protein